MEDAQIQGQQQQNEKDKSDPDPKHATYLSRHALVLPVRKDRSVAAGIEGCIGSVLTTAHARMGGRLLPNGRLCS